MGRYKSAKQQRDEAQKRSAYVKIALVVVALLGLLGAYVQIMGGRKSLDMVTQCPASPESITVLGSCS